MKVNFMSPDKVHYKWDNSLEPALVIDPGDRVVYELRDVSDYQINPNSTVEDLKNLDWSRLYPLAGPVYVNGAEPGDALIVKVVDIKTKGWGWSAIIPGYGLLNDVEYFDYYLRIWDLSSGEFTMLDDKVIIPLNPFCGVMGVARAEKGEFPVMPPGSFGGNMDCKHLTRGSTLYLPVFVKGALFSVGDGHAAQGDGEVCVTAIEAPLYVVLEFDLIKNANLKRPQAIIHKDPIRTFDTYYLTVGVGSDLMTAARDAVLDMIDLIVSKHKLSREDAYILTSIMADLKISEIVDKPNWIVTAHLPKDIFIEEG
ncbi:MAG: acetamidase/formamidase family protein [archaeon GB-1867-005]|nr:acetamidase/formamidase family protein [Candidatus Culexmicrobium cathedralense]